MITKPADSFACILNCEKCSDSGIVFACNRDEWNSAAYAFRCNCRSGDMKKTSLQALPLHSRWVPEYVDKRPTPQWLDIIFRNKNSGEENPDFKRRVGIWGRDWFAFKLKEWREEQREKLTNEQTQERAGDS